MKYYNEQMGGGVRCGAAVCNVMISWLERADRIRQNDEEVRLAAAELG